MLPSSSAAAAAQERFGLEGRYKLKPQRFASAAALEWEGDLTEAHGAWAEGGDGSRSWRLCLEAPEGTASLTVLFRWVAGHAAVVQKSGAER